MLEEAAERHHQLNTSKPITLRINQLDLIKIKAKAKRNNIPYQTLLGAVVHDFAEDRVEDKVNINTKMTHTQVCVIFVAGDEGFATCGQQKPATGSFAHSPSHPTQLTNNRKHPRRGGCFLLAGDEGFEPPNAWTKTRCLTTWPIPNILLHSQK